jgi:hypothetical protein
MRRINCAAPQQLGDLLALGWGVVSTPQILTRPRDFHSAAGGDHKKTAQSWRVSGGLFALTHEPAQTTKAGKTKQKPNVKQEKTYANQTISNQHRHSRLWLAVDATSS